MFIVGLVAVLPRIDFVVFPSFVSEVRLWQDYLIGFLQISWIFSNRVPSDPVGQVLWPARHMLSRKESMSLICPLPRTDKGCQM